MLCQRFAIEDGIGRGARKVSTAMNPQHDWLRRLRRPLGRPDVEVKAIFAYAFAVLHAPRTKLRGLANARPCFHRGGLPPTQITYGRRCKRNAFENRAALHSTSLNFSTGDRHHWRIWLTGRKGGNCHNRHNFDKSSHLLFPALSTSFVEKNGRT